MAATSTIKEFLVGLGFSIDEAGLTKFQSAISSATVIALGLGAAVTTAAGAVLAAVKGVAGEYDELDKLATRFRTTAEAVDEFADIGKVLGLSDEQTIGSLKALDKAIGDTALGLGRAKKVFEEIGLEVLDAGGKMKPTTQVMDDLAAKLATMERGKALAVMDRLGLDPALLKVFNADLGALRADLEAIDKAAGFDLSEAVEQSKGFMKAWKGLTQEFAKVRLVWDKLYESIAVKLMPVMRHAIDDFRRRIETFRKLLMDNFEGLRKIIGGTVEFLVATFGGIWQLIGRVFDLIVTAVQKVIRAFDGWDSTLTMLTAMVAGLAAAWWLLNSALLASPVTWVLALGAALLLLWDDYQTWKEGGKSLIDWGAWKAEIDLVTGIVETFVDFLTNAFTLLFATIDGLAKLLRGDFSGAWFAVGEAVNSVIGIFRSSYEWLTKLFDLAGRFIGIKPASIKAAADAQFAAGNFDAMGNPLGGATVGDQTPAGASVTLQQNTEIKVEGAGDPGAVARAVAGEQGRVNADGVRNMKGSVR